jgi:hypothetical protein
MKEKRSWVDRLNRTLFPYLGPPALGPYDEPPLAPTGPKPCPICGARMDAHVFQRGTATVPTRMICPEGKAYVLPDQSSKSA